jgi:putative aldouronate transport system permease protein
MSSSAIPRWAGARTRPRRRLVHGAPPPSAGTRVLKGIVLVICCALVIGPFVSVVATSFAGNKQVAAAGGFVIWPDHPTLNAYRAVLAGGVVTRALLVSAGITVVGTAISLAGTALLAYALSRPGSLGHKPLLIMVLLTLLFAPGIIPNYLLVQSLGLINSYWSLILPVAISGFNVIIVRAFFVELPPELIDSARIDGAGDVGIFFRIVLPLSKAVLAVIGLFYAVGYWNSFFNALLYLNDNAKWPIQMVVVTYIINGTSLSPDQIALNGTVPPPQSSLDMAIVVLAVVPVLLIYPFVQRYFTKGVILGAVKG